MSAFILAKIIEALLLPPGALILAGMAGVALLRRHPRWGHGVLVTTLLVTWLLSSQWVSKSMLLSLAPERADPLLAPLAQAVVVLGAGRYFDAPEYGGDTVNEPSLARARYAARLSRETRRPLLVSGGKPEGGERTEAAVLKEVLENDFSTPVMWEDNDSNTTAEQAVNARAILRPLGVDRIYLVTHDWHMRRAQKAFEEAGFRVVAAPTEYVERGPYKITDFLPTSAGLTGSVFVCHELLGLLWYRLKSWAS